MYGKLEYYNAAYDRITTKSSRLLERVERIHHCVSTSDDPVLRRYSSEEAGEVETLSFLFPLIFQVFATDSILIMIMASLQSVYSWDIIVERVGKKLFFNKRDDPSLDLLTVNETSPDYQRVDEKDSINSQLSLSREATFINQNFSQQVLQRVFLIFVRSFTLNRLLAPQSR